jgi:hypothetical protein
MLRAAARSFHLAPKAVLFQYLSLQNNAMIAARRDSEASWL